MRNIDQSLPHHIALAFCLSLTLQCVIQKASAEAQRRPHIVKLSGPILKAISVASDRFLKEEERKFSEVNKKGMAGLRCLTEIQSYDVEVREDRTSYVVEFILNSSCPMATGGGAEVALRKADFAIMEVKYGE